MMTVSEMQAHIINKSVDDAEFRARLLQDPKGTVEQELDVTIPEGYTLQVHEESDTTAHMVLPPSSRLEQEALAGIAAGCVGDLDCSWLSS